MDEFYFGQAKFEGTVRLQHSEGRELKAQVMQSFYLKVMKLRVRAARLPKGSQLFRSTRFPEFQFRPLSTTSTCLVVE